MANKLTGEETMDNIIANKNSKEFCDKFQEQVSELLIRHKSIIDIMTKLDEYTSRINRAVAKSVTTCGCISIHAEKQNFDGEYFEELQGKVSSHLEGKLCPNCKDIIEAEIGNSMFYLTSLCNSLNLKLYDILQKEYERNETLGIYSLK